LVKKFLALNQEAPEPLVEVLLLSRNAFDTGLRIFNSIAHYKLAIIRAAFAGGESPYEYAKAFGAHLFLSLNPESVQGALESGCAAATIWNSSSPLHNNNPTDQLRIAFDGDAVLFSDEAERIFQGEGLEKFHKTEWSAKDKPLPPGPFKGFLEALHQLQAIKPGHIRTALITARSAPAHERVINTLRTWDIRIDEALFLGGMDKGAFLSAFGADIFFDDQKHHCQSATQQSVTAGHVPYGVVNQ
jgi:5'-nucleotidase